MRKQKLFGMDPAEAVSLFKNSRVVHMAGVGADGRPVLKTIHAVVVDGLLAFHSAPVGEKIELLATPVIICAEDIVADIPSYFIDPRVRA